MIKVISIEEYNELKFDVDYWKELAITAVNEHTKRVDEYKTLKDKYDELKEQKQEKVTFISLKGVNSLSKTKKIAEEVKKLIDDENKYK